MPIDIWSLLTGLAGFVSLALTIPEKYATWRKWVGPLGWASAGLAFGRVSALLGPSADAAFADPALIGVLGILAVCLGGLFLIMRTIKTSMNVEGILWIILIVGTMWGMSSIVNRYLDSVKPQLRIAELIEFAGYKESRGDLAMAVHYLTVALKATQDRSEKDRIAAKIKDIDARQLPTAPSVDSKGSSR